MGDRGRILSLAVAAFATAACASGCTGAQAPPGPHDGRPENLRTDASRKGREATFDARNAFDFDLSEAVAEGARDVQMWCVLPQDDPLQEVVSLDISSPLPHEVRTDSAGNKVLHVRGRVPAGGKFQVVTQFRVRRWEHVPSADPSSTRPLTEEEMRQFAADLAPNRNVVITQDIRKAARDAVGGETNPVLKARRIYDWVLANVDYWVKDPELKKASPVGSSEYCMTSRTGNCTDFHSLYTAMARAEGIPTRMVYGTLFKPELEGQDKDASYHCWVTFYAPNLGWVPLDVSVADIYLGDFPTTEANAEKVRLTTSDGYRGAEPAKVDYYFGGLDERRIVFSRGRDLTFDPPAAAGAVNALAKCHVELDGKPVAEKSGWTRKFTYRSVP